MPEPSNFPGINTKESDVVARATWFRLTTARALRGRDKWSAATDHIFALFVRALVFKKRIVSISCVLLITLRNQVAPTVLDPSLSCPLITTPFCRGY